MRNLCTTLHTEELLKTWASCCVVDSPLTFSYERIPEEKLHRTGDHHNELKTGGGGAHEAEAGLQSQNTNQGTADHGGTEIHVALLNNDHHQPGFVLAFSTNYCSTGRHSSLWRQKHRLCKEQRRGCVFTLMLTGAQTDRHHSSQHSHFDLFMVVIVVTVCVPSRITLPLPCFYITVSLLSTCDTSQTIHELQGCWPSRCQVQPEESHHRCKGRLQAEASQSFQGGDPIIYKL